MIDLDAPEIVNRLFYPRPARRDTSTVPRTQDGTIRVDDNVRLGYRLYRPENPRAVIVFFHGNGEVASDYDFIAPHYFNIRAALMVVDYRGYGWSNGSPLTSTLLTDAEAVIPALPDALGESLNTLSKYVMGRSLGSAPAIHLAYKFPDTFKGLIVESGFADMPSVVRHLGIPVDLSQISDLPIANARRMQEITLPSVVIHGEDDHLLPIENGEKLHDAATHANKVFLRIAGAGHNNIMYRAGRMYFDAISLLIDKTHMH